MSPLAPDLSNDNEPQGPTRRVFRPKLAASLIALLMFGCLLGLGTWQARRYQESTATIAAYSAQHDQPPLKTLGGVTGDGDDNGEEERCCSCFQEIFRSCSLFRQRGGGGGGAPSRQARARQAPEKLQGVKF